ncbi:hypothetical protein BaRGS_00001116 [Batillaria attramentaria]|uniref:Uncharacterized protein n=1 Tax=Batillaria attramentaria TaxID=370345 RepID=A0ABD0M748_9CAEN
MQRLLRSATQARTKTDRSVPFPRMSLPVPLRTIHALVRVTPGKQYNSFDGDVVNTDPKRLFASQKSGPMRTEKKFKSSMKRSGVVPYLDGMIAQLLQLCSMLSYNQANQAQEGKLLRSVQTFEVSSSTLAVSHAKLRSGTICENSLRVRTGRSRAVREKRIPCKGEKRRENGALKAVATRVVSQLGSALKELAKVRSGESAKWTVYY